jgi:hypothetical protein
VRNTLFSFVPALLILTTCGADNKEAPPAEKVDSERQCDGFNILAPSFVKALATGRTENLKRVVETQLLKPTREGGSPPISDVLRSIFATLTRLSQKPPERGAVGGQYCAPPTAPPPLASSNEICELRRALDLTVHQGKALQAVTALGPQATILFNYLAGRGLDCKGRPRTPHLEVSAIISNLCSQDANCQVNDGLDLVIGLAAYTQSADADVLVEHLTSLSGSANVSAFLDPSKLTENDAVAIVRALIPALANADAAALENAFNTLPLSDALKTEFRPLVNDVKKILSRGTITTPTKRALNCFTTKDKNLDLVRALYRLSIEESCPSFGLTQLAQSVSQLQGIDTRGSQGFLLQTLAQAVRDDDTAVDSAAQVCRTLFSNTPTQGEVRSNAQLVIPVLAELFEGGIVNEVLCALDVLLFGCSGGRSPACR